MYMILTIFKFYSILIYAIYSFCVFVFYLLSFFISYSAYILLLTISISYFTINLQRRGLVVETLCRGLVVETLCRGLVVETLCQSPRRGDIMPWISRGYIKRTSILFENHANIPDRWESITWCGCIKIKKRSPIPPISIACLLNRFSYNPP
jgi:hypothetical protein